ncbi:MAG: hypothetical protein UD936_01850 [Acutalibacteraceae bacterium]|nr:hypothetical protein [Acutalibacteraceae bacterium]
MIFGLYMVIISLFFTAGMVREKLHYHNMVNNGISVYAEVTDTTYSTKSSSYHTGKGGRSSGKSIYYHIYTVYEVDNQEYPIEFKTQSTKFLDDKTLHIFYQDGDPTKYVVEGDSGGPVIVMFIPLGIGAALAIAGFKKHRDEKDLKAMGLL